MASVLTSAADTVKSIIPGINTDVPSTEGSKPDFDPVLSPASQEAKLKLEKSLKERPEKKDLVDRNILKDSSAAPALQAAQEKLQRAQLNDRLDHALQQRPKPEELVAGGILLKDEAPAATV